ncbi:MAG: hypothetical protein NW224_22855 [Leptolyngbyaceae cyanobacterium bins.302]|nr:hypothetical protein [Leptolyngbyaceae cyanobacterium bins.302]
MTFNIRQLDHLSYDDVEPILDDYINGAIQQFVNSPEGKAHIEAYPEGGYWIGSFIEMGYLYGEVPLPKMTKGDVQNLMEYTLPRKVTIFDPSEAEAAIPELVAFWKFIQREYQFRSAGAIGKYLETLASKFPAMMCDPTRGGIAKAFMMMGHQAGFDMTTQAGIQAFQQHYNNSLKSDSPDAITNTLKAAIQGGLPPSPSIPKGVGAAKTNSTKQTRKKSGRKKK